MSLTIRCMLSLEPQEEVPLCHCLVPYNPLEQLTPSPNMLQSSIDAKSIQTTLELKNLSHLQMELCIIISHHLIHFASKKMCKQWA